MSVLINMEMPTSCADCRLMADGWCYSVGLEQREKISTVKRPTWCPLVPVPPHGRTIDADALMELYADTDDLRLEDMKVPIAVIRQNIMDMPTIIPADPPKTEKTVMWKKIEAVPTIIPADSAEEGE